MVRLANGALSVIHRWYGPIHAERTSRLLDLCAIGWYFVNSSCHQPRQNVQDAGSCWLTAYTTPAELLHIRGTSQVWCALRIGWFVRCPSSSALSLGVEQRRSWYCALAKPSAASRLCRHSIHGIDFYLLPGFRTNFWLALSSWPWRLMLHRQSPDKTWMTRSKTKYGDCRCLDTQALVRRVQHLIAGKRDTCAHSKDTRLAIPPFVSASPCAKGFTV